jgi:hypothetical protein
VGLGLSICAVLGCGDGDNEPPQVPADLARYATLPLLAQTHEPGLRHELALIVREQGTPALLDTTTTGTGKNSKAAPAGDEADNAASDGFADVFPPETLELLAERLESIYPQGDFDISGMALREAIDLRQTYDDLRERARRKLAEPTFRFQVQHALGLTLDTSFVDAARVASRLEAMLAAECLYGEAPRGAIEPLAMIMQIAEALAREKHVVPRLAAVEIRREALHILDAIATHDRITVSDQRRLASMIRGQLDRWPPDQDAWIGDRASGMHTYELVRDGLLLSILSYEEIREYRNDVSIDKLGKVVAENLDQDELFYLKAMRELISACDRPFYKRRKFFQQLARDLEQLRATAAYPFVADQLLLINTESGHRLQALDRAQCEAWWIALAQAVDDPVDENLVNPLTGFPYIVDVRSKQVIVDGIDPERHAASIEVPIRR